MNLLDRFLRSPGGPSPTWRGLLGCGCLLNSLLLVVLVPLAFMLLGPDRRPEHWSQRAREHQQALLAHQAILLQRGHELAPIPPAPAALEPQRPAYHEGEERWFEHGWASYCDFAVLPIESASGAGPLLWSLSICDTDMDRSVEFTELWLDPLEVGTRERAAGLVFGSPRSLPIRLPDATAGGAP